MSSGCNIKAKKKDIVNYDLKGTTLRYDQLDCISSGESKKVLSV